jgi:hypothetical protein
MHGNNDYWLVAPIIRKPHYYPFSCQKGLDLPPVSVATEAGFEDLDPITAPSGTSLLERRCKLQSISSNKEVRRLDSDGRSLTGDFEKQIVAQYEEESSLLTPTILLLTCVPPWNLRSHVIRIRSLLGLQAPT